MDERLNYSLNLNFLLRNCSDYDSYGLRTFVISGCLAPIVILMGCICNFANILVFSDTFMRNSLVNWYLLGLSISDTLILISSFFMLCFPPIADYTGQWTFVEASNYLMRYFYPVGLTAQTQSVWLTVAVAIHRCIGVATPFRAQQIYTKGRVKTCLSLVTCFSILYNITRPLELDLVTCWSSHFHREMRTLETSKFRGHQIYQLYYMTGSYMVIMFIIPISVLIVTNAITIYTVRQSYKKRKFFTNSMAKDPAEQPLKKSCQQSRYFVKEQQANATGTTLMLVGVVFVFLLCNSFGFLTNILELVVKSSANRDIFLTQIYSILVDISNFVVVVNSSINIAIYYGFSKRYRQAFHQIFIRNPSPTTVTTVGSNNRSPSVAL